MEEEQHHHAAASAVADAAGSGSGSATDDHDLSNHEEEDHEPTNPHQRRRQPQPSSSPKKKKRQGQRRCQGQQGPKKKKQQSQSATDAMTPITLDGDKPKKKFYRQRAHCNPLSHNTAFDYPLMPSQVDWSHDHYPGLRLSANNTNDNDDDTTTAAAAAAASLAPTVLDIGCGFGGLTVKLATLLPNERILGMEIRAKVTEYVRLRLLALRKDHQDQGMKMYENASVLRTNSMKYLPNYFGKATLKKLFFCFPDPHFKRKNWPRRIVSERLLSEYAYCLKSPTVTTTTDGGDGDDESGGGGKLYTITDVKELHDWHVQMCDSHPLFRRVEVWNGGGGGESKDGEEDAAALKNTEDDPCIAAMYTATEEGQKVARNGGKKYYAVYERIDDDAELLEHDKHKWTAENFFNPVEEEEEDEQEEASQEEEKEQERRD